MKKFFIYFFPFLILSIYAFFALKFFPYSNLEIPKDFFNSKHYDKEYNSEQNWYIELKEILKDIKKIENNIVYYRTLFDCYDENDSICENAKKYIEDEEKLYSLKSMQLFINSTNKKLENLENYDYIYSYNKENIWGENIFLYFYDYFIVSNNIAKKYIEENNIEKWINLLIENQNIINSLIQKSDFDYTENLSLLVLEKNNLESIKYITEKYIIYDKYKNKLIELLSKENDYDLITNWIIRDSNIYTQDLDKNLEVFYPKHSNDFFYNNKLFFLYSRAETINLLNEGLYKVINNKWVLGEFKINNSFYNYIWKKIVLWLLQDYSSSYKKEEDNKLLQKNIATNLKDEDNDISNKIKLNNEIEKDLWNWFILKQTMNETYLLYNWKKIYTRSHKSEINPFIWDEACTKLFVLFSNNTNNDNKKYKQEAWESLLEEWQKSCIKEYLNKSISIKTTPNSNFFVIKKQNYESKELLIYNILNNQLFSLEFWEIVKKISLWNSWTYVQYEWEKWCAWWLTLYEINTNKKIDLFLNKCDIDFENNSSAYKKILDFELMPGKQVKVIYMWALKEKKEKIINL